MLLFSYCWTLMLFPIVFTLIRAMMYIKPCIFRYKNLFLQFSWPHFNQVDKLKDINSVKDLDTCGYNCFPES